MDNHEGVMLFEPAAAAEALHVSASGLRRLAPIYEAVYGKLPRTGKGDPDKQARLWPSEAIERLSSARTLVESDKHKTIKRYKTIQEALEALRDGLVDTEALDVTEAAQGASDTATQRTLEVLLSEIKILRGEVQELKQGKELEAPTKQIDPKQHGYLVDLAIKLEALLRRFR